MSQFASLKIAEIRPLLISIGARTSGHKSQLIQKLERDIRRPKLALPLDGKSTRILSVDMGIKNLAFCVCDVRRKSSSQNLAIQVREWKRIGVVESAAPQLVQDSDGDIREDEEAFGPSSLSKDAFQLVHNVLWPYDANTILVERQRFRSGGGSAVQEWTLRVNMLESMIWAISRSLSAISPMSAPCLWPVNPKQVATFWMNGQVLEGTATTRSKIEKKQKIALVHKWLSDGSSDQSLSFDFVENAADTKQAFLASATGKRDAASKPRKVHVTKNSEVRISKLDDLADCLLQAAAWCKWEQNRSALALTLPANPSQVVNKTEESVSGRKQGSSPRRKERATAAITKHL